MFGLPNPYVAIAGALIAVSVIVGSFFYGRHVEHQSNIVDKLESALAIQKLDRRIDKSARDEAAAGALQIDAADKKNQEIVNGPLPKPKPDGGCPRCATAADIKWLRSIQ